MTDRQPVDRRAYRLGGRRSEDQHGTRSLYARGCRCEPCRQAQAVYRRQQATGQILTWVTADAARAHLERLRASGVGSLRLSVLTGISRRTLQHIAQGHRSRIHPETEARILAVTHPSLADGALVSQADSYATRERLRRIMEEQFPLPFVRQHAGRYAVQEARATNRRGVTGARVTVKTWKRVQALYRRTLLDELDGSVAC